MVVESANLHPFCVLRLPQRWARTEGWVLGLGSGGKSILCGILIQCLLLLVVLIASRGPLPRVTSILPMSYKAARPLAITLPQRIFAKHLECILSA
jgi:hypothetical protein